jgi:hypothetical protein
MIFQYSQEAMYTASKCFYMYVGWRWHMEFKTCCFNKNQNLVLLTAVILHSYHTVTWWDVHMTVFDESVLWNMAMAEHSKVFKANYVVYVQHIPLYLSIMFHWSIKSKLILMPSSSFYSAGSYLLRSKFNLLASIITKLCNQWQPKNTCTVSKQSIKAWFKHVLTFFSNKYIYILPFHTRRWQTIHGQHLPKAPDIPKSSWGSTKNEMREVHDNKLQQMLQHAENMLQLVF